MRVADICLALVKYGFEGQTLMIPEIFGKNMLILKGRYERFVGFDEVAEIGKQRCPLSRRSRPLPHLTRHVGSWGRKDVRRRGERDAG